MHQDPTAKYHSSIQRLFTGFSICAISQSGSDSLFLLHPYQHQIPYFCFIPIRICFLIAAAIMSRNEEQKLPKFPTSEFFDDFESSEEMNNDEEDEYLKNEYNRTSAYDNDETESLYDESCENTFYESSSEDDESYARENDNFLAGTSIGEWSLKRFKARKDTLQVYRCEEKLDDIVRDGLPYPPNEGSVLSYCKKYWYHGTSLGAVRDILENGINLHLGRPRQDFSHEDGFYLNPVFDDARHWACNRKYNDPAVIVFNHPFKSNKFNKLSLNSDKDDWQSIVKYNRSGRLQEVSRVDKDLIQMFEDCDYIEGPMSSARCPITGSVFQTWEPYGFHLPFKQMCIKSEELAKSFWQSIESIIVYPRCEPDEE